MSRRGTLTIMVMKTHTIIYPRYPFIYSLFPLYTLYSPSYTLSTAPDPHTPSPPSQTLIPPLHRPTPSYPLSAVPSELLFLDIGDEEPFDHLKEIRRKHLGTAGGTGGGTSRFNSNVKRSGGIGGHTKQGQAEQEFHQMRRNYDDASNTLKLKRELRNKQAAGKLELLELSELLESV